MLLLEVFVIKENVAGGKQLYCLIYIVYRTTRFLNVKVIIDKMIASGKLCKSVSNIKYL